MTTVWIVMYEDPYECGARYIAHAASSRKRAEEWLNRKVAEEMRGYQPGNPFGREHHVRLPYRIEDPVEVDAP